MDDCFTVAIALSASRSTAFLDEKMVHQGSVRPGSILTSAPAQEARCWLEDASDSLHIYVTQQAVAAACADCWQGSGPYEMRLRVALKSHDPILMQLASAAVLLDMEGLQATLLYRDNLETLILRRLVSCHTEATQALPSGSALPNWRMRRVIEFVEDNLDQDFNLATLAQAACLSPMYFAAQFRATTGLSPHKYVTRRRIERAQQLLSQSSVPLAEVAVAVGFSSQTHFTTVFRTTVGQTPGRWRRSMQL